MGRVEILTGIERRRVWADLRLAQEASVGTTSRRVSGVTLLPVALIGPDAEGDTDRTPAAERAAAKTAVKAVARRIGCNRPRPEGRCLDCAGSPEGPDPVGGRSMIGQSANARVYLACGVTDMRKGIDGLTASTLVTSTFYPCLGQKYEKHLDRTLTFGKLDAQV